MNVVLYRYGSICEPDIIAGFQKLGLNVIEITEEIQNKMITPSRQVELVNKAIEEYSPSFVFSINFFPAVAKICHVLGVFYLCWTVDSPVLELFSEAISYDTNRIFLFDRVQYQYFHRFNSNGTFHLPLASAVDRFDRVIGERISGNCRVTNGMEKTKQPAQQSKENADAQWDFTGDITFVGSLYSEKSPLSRVKLSDRTAGYIDGICEATLKVYGYNFMEEALSDECVGEIKRTFPDFFTLKDKVPELTDEEIDRYVAAHYYVGYLEAQKERVRTLNTLAEHFKVDMFEIGVDLESYGSMEELIDKCAYYLSHEEERARIAMNGYQKVKQFDTYDVRIREMLSAATA